MSSLDAHRADIQGNILRAYGIGFPYARFELFRIAEAAGARRLLSDLLDRRLVTTAEAWTPGQKPEATLNVYVSWRGLAALGVKEAWLQSFPSEFREGMPARASTLGDVGANAPDAWEFGADAERIHLCFVIYGASAAARDRQAEALRAAIARAGTPDSMQAGAHAGAQAGAGRVAPLESTHHLDAALLANHREHFGFADGIGQPSIEGGGEVEYPGDGTPGANGWVPLKVGEFLLGWPGETGRPGPTPASEIAQNGSFVVYRKLQQHVGAFRAFVREQAARVYGSSDPAHVERLAAKLVGRWRSGCPVARAPEQDDPAIAADWQRNNDFRYGSDPEGLACPVGAHVRRMNPRDGLPHGDSLVQLHRIIRRGLPYGAWLEADEDDGADRGVAFMAINASIAYQFEFLQAEWINNGEFAGLGRGDVDPLAGEPRADSRFRIPVAGARPANLFDLPRFVTLRGGGYFFIPSLSALRLITRDPTTRPPGAPDA